MKTLKCFILFFIISFNISGQILLSEYVEGSSYNKYIEIYNYSNESVNLYPDYVLASCTNGCIDGNNFYINEFPDTDADKSKGRFHLVARLGKEKAVGLYNIIMGLSYVIIVIGVISSFVIGIGIPPTCIIALSTFSLTPKGNFRTASKILSKEYDKIMELIPAMGNTVMTTIQTGVLLLIGYLIWYFLSIYFPGTTTILPGNIS